MERLEDYIKEGSSLDITIEKTAITGSYKLRINGESPFTITVRELLRLQCNYQEEEEEADDTEEYEERSEATGALFIVRAIARQIRRMGQMGFNSVGLYIQI